jgi:hypothetical protein
MVVLEPAVEAPELGLELADAPGVVDRRGTLARLRTIEASLRRRATSSSP